MLVCGDFIDTLEIITRTLREVEIRERLCDTNAFYFGDFRNFWGCQTPCISWLLLGCLVAEILSHSGDHSAHSTQSGKQREIVPSSQPGSCSCGEVHVYGAVMRR